jgi:deoxyribonuclease V
VLKEALKRLSVFPDVILVDGQGVLHPRRLGLATHLGLEVGLPTIGVAKKPLIGQFGEIPEEPGRWVPIVVEGEVRGAVLRTRRGVKPVYVSPGHLITLAQALAIVQKCLTKYRLPEPVRLAHLLSQRVRRSTDF